MYYSTYATSSLHSLCHVNLDGIVIQKLSCSANNTWGYVLDKLVIHFGLVMSL